MTDVTRKQGKQGTGLSESDEQVPRELTERARDEGEGGAELER